LSTFPSKSRLGKFCTPTTTFLFEIGVFRPTCKEVSEGSLQMPQSLLQWHTANLVQKLEVFKLFPLRQHSGGLNVVYSLLPGVPSFCSRCQGFVKHQPHTTNCPSQYLFLLGSWVKSVAVGFFHALHSTRFHVKPSPDGVSNPFF
jgi:hypothetical protein